MFERSPSPNGVGDHPTRQQKHLGRRGGRPVRWAGNVNMSQPGSRPVPDPSSKPGTKPAPAKPSPSAAATAPKPAPAAQPQPRPARPVAPVTVAGTGPTDIPVGVAIA